MSKPSRATCALLGALFAATLVGCPAKYAAWLVPQARRESPVFGLARERGGDDPAPLMLVRVTTCAGFTSDLRRVLEHPMWVARADYQGEAAGRVRYGVTPTGLRDSLPARTLTPGCYHFSADANPGSAGVSFWVTGDGSVREWTRAEVDSARALGYAHYRAESAADARATGACRRGYAVVRSAAESSRIDAQVYYDTTRFANISCGELRRLMRRDFLPR